jgi:hypothetical protein
MVCTVPFEDSQLVRQLQLQAIITETWIGDPELWEPLRNFIDEIADFIRSKNLCFYGTDLVLYCSLDHEDQAWCGYYFVSHSTRSLFWLEKFEINQHLDELRGELHPSHISKPPSSLDSKFRMVMLPPTELFLESQYWYTYPQVQMLFSRLTLPRYHWNLYPDVNEATGEILDMLSNTILDAQTGNFSGYLSTYNDVMWCKRYLDGQRINRQLY